jgi:hypothetical protein
LGAALSFPKTPTPGNTYMQEKEKKKKDEQADNKQKRKRKQNDTRIEHW